MAKKESGKKGGKKIGRLLRKPSHNRYTAEKRWLKNAVRNLKRHLKKHPKDKTALKALSLK
jgi:ribosomal protein S15P/S13E